MTTDPKNFPKPPFSAVFKKDGKTLVFVAARHEQGHESDTALTIKSAFADYKPNIVITEGTPYSDGINPRNLLALPDGEKKDEKTCLITLARDDSIPVIGGEAGDKDILNKTLELGYTLNDFLYFYFLRRLVQEKREGRLNDDDQLQGFYDRFIGRVLSDVEHNGYNDHSYNRFLDWYKEKTGKDFSFSLVNPETAAPQPVSGEARNFVHELSHDLSTRARDPAIIDNLLKQMQENDKVMAVFGSGHFYDQYASLKEKLGEPTIEKPITSQWRGAIRAEPVSRSVPRYPT